MSSRARRVLRGAGACLGQCAATATLLVGVACHPPPPLEDVSEVKVPVVDALDKPKGDSKVMMELHAGDVLTTLPGEPSSFERKGKTLSYRRMRRAAEDHAGLVAVEAVVDARAPTTSYFCGLLGEAEGRACPTSLVRIHLPSGDYLVYRPSLNEQGRLALVEGHKTASREVRGLSSVYVRTVGGKPWLFVESAVRKSELWTATELSIVAPDRSLRTRKTLLLQEVDGRAGSRFMRSAVVVEDGKLRRRGTSYVLGEDGTPAQQTTIDEEVVIPP